ncbi:hypothetical protein KAR48_19250 [bacterium]|nr:hypothetical protein [bacterium]
MAASFRSIGVNARVSPPSDDNTLVLGALHTTGEECLPQRVVMGNFFKIIRSPGFKASEHAFLMPTSSGPCRFGQYMNLFKKALKDEGFEDALVFSPTSSDGYEGIAGNQIRFLRTGWRAIIIADILRKLRLMYRPYEKDSGSTDELHQLALEKVCSILSDGRPGLRHQLRQLVDALNEIVDSYELLPLNSSLGSRPLIGVVGEIYLRFNSFSNQDVLRRIEQHGGEAWIADIGEWVWYTNFEERRKLKEAKKQFSLEMVRVKIRHYLQHRDETALLKPFKSIFASRPEACIDEILNLSRPYLPAEQALGEMTINTGKVIAFQQAGCAGVVDISPFACMNGIVTEVIYPHVSRDLRGFPIKIFYFDGVPAQLDRDLEIFMEQAQGYGKKMTKSKIQMTNSK